MIRHSSLQWQPLSYSLAVLIYISDATGLVSKVFAGELPPAPQTEADLSPVLKLYLELIVNKYSTQRVIPVIVKGGDYYIEYKKIQDLKIIIPAHSADTSNQAINENSLNKNDILLVGFANNPTDWINLSTMPEVKFEYLAAQQSLVLNFPPSWMPIQMLGRDTLYQGSSGQSGFGLLNNYDLYLSRSNDQAITGKLFSEQRIFSGYGVFKNLGIYTQQARTNKARASLNHPYNGYRRYESTFQYDHEASATSILLGDIISASKNSWGNSIRLGGLQIKRDFGTRPDLITYPLPQFLGQATLPSHIDLLINGQKIQTADVQSGPFLMQSLPYMTGRGEAIIVTTDAVGRRVSTAIPFYISNHLLKPGLIDYAFSIGQIRKGFGSKDFNYGAFVSSVDARYGLYNWLTLEGRAELSKKIQVFGIGTVTKLSQFGILSASYASSRAELEPNQMPIVALSHTQIGNQYSIGYYYSQQHFGLSLNHRYQDKNYADLSRLGYYNAAYNNSQEMTTAQSFFSTPQLGSWGIAYIQAQSTNVKNKLMNLSWTPKLPRDLSNILVSVSASQDLIKNEWSAALQVSIPIFHNRSILNTSYSKGVNSNTGMINLNRSVPSDGGLGIDLTHRFGSEGRDLNQANIHYQHPYFNTSFGASSFRNDYDYWFGLVGSIVWMKQGVFMSNRLGESFALIDTNHVPDIPIQYENSLIGRSNRKGYAFVSSIPPYYAGKYNIDPLALSSNYIATSVEKRVAAKRGSGIVITFPVIQSIAANVYLVNQQNQPIPVGALVHRIDHESSYVGIDGIAYLENLQSENEITVQYADHQVCKAKFSVDMESAKLEILTIRHIQCLTQVEDQVK